MPSTDTQKSIVDQMKTAITGLKDGLKTYPIRELVNHAKEFGPYLKQQRLETNQVRKFLDAINQIKALLAQQNDDKNLQDELEIIQRQAKEEKEEIRRDKNIAKEDFNLKIQKKQEQIDKLIQVKIAQQDEDSALKEQIENLQNQKNEIKKNKNLTEDVFNVKLQNIQKQADDKKDRLIFPKIEADVVLLKPKLAYAAARQRSAKPLEEVISLAIDKVESAKDFERLVQLIESIIAYHKAEGGK